MANIFKKKTIVEYSNIFIETDDLLKKTKSLNNNESDLVNSLFKIEQQNKKNKVICEKFKVVMLGMNYLDWLEKNKYVDSLNVREEYANGLSIDELEKEFVDNGGTINIITMFIPFMVFQDNIDKENKNFFCLNEKVLNELYLELSSNLNIDKNCICIVPQIIQYQMAEKNIDKISSIIESKLIDNTNISFGALNILELNEKVNISAFCISIGLKLTLDSCIIQKDWKEIEEYKVIYSYLEVDNIVKTLTDNFNEISKNENREVYLLSPILLFVDEINEVYKKFIKKLKKELNKCKMDIQLV